MLEIKECPYCGNELFVWRNYNLCKCDNDDGACNFGERTIDELEQIVEGEFEEEHAETIELMTTYDNGMK